MLYVLTLKTISTVNRMPINSFYLTCLQSKALNHFQNSKKNALKSESTAVVKLNKVQTIYPHTSMSIPIPEKFKSHSEVLIEPFGK